MECFCKCVCLHVLVSVCVSGHVVLYLHRFPSDLLCSLLLPPLCLLASFLFLNCIFCYLSFPSFLLFYLLFRLSFFISSYHVFSYFVSFFYLAMQVGVEKAKLAGKQGWEETKKAGRYSYCFASHYINSTLYLCISFALTPSFYYV